MENERVENRNEVMDLNLYLGLPRSPSQELELDIGSHLALSWPPSMEGGLVDDDNSSPENPDSINQNPSNSPRENAAHNRTYEYNPEVSAPILSEQTMEQQVSNNEISEPLVVDVNNTIFPVVSQGNRENVIHDSNLTDLQPYVMDSPGLLSTQMYPEHLMLETIPTPSDLLSERHNRIPQTNNESFLWGRSSPYALHQVQYRLQRLIESNRRFTGNRSASAAINEDDQVSYEFPFGSSDPTAFDVDSSVMNHENPDVNNESAKGILTEDSEENRKEPKDDDGYFDCNICLEMSKDPVVTTCGHLFCWRCLYQWLYVHSDHKECPVCKGEVLESNITPIYGRGSCSVGDEKDGKDVQNESDARIPPRPHGQRIESRRQQRARRPFWRVYGQEIRTWRRIIDEEMQTRNRVQDQDESILPRIFDGRSRLLLNRLRTLQWNQREARMENNHEDRRVQPLPVGMETDSNQQIPMPPHVDLPIRSSRRLRIRRGTNNLHPPDSERSPVAIGDVPNEPIGSVSMNVHGSELRQNGITYGAIIPSADQASASSTAAMIQDISGGVSTEPTSVGSPHDRRRRRRNDPSSNLDVLPSRRRRRGQ